ncbi:hypothetical protein K443DRAFT_676464 [Laccaria amethystina LaAM-08-1]|uniref:Unplaced genomic scaffold K443scaffold_41, whole genome shotgun sequence n=1 Tax=Laccaria amethystina LaAM-08-1 TaxID=1095629 RepID=A0A0C9XFS8_9AGAR|nr:hypothetical protein K443DRAFT_676464 [Laccaria amethystina LaAM-08-1]
MWTSGASCRNSLRNKNTRLPALPKAKTAKSKKLLLHSLGKPFLQILDPSHV